MGSLRITPLIRKAIGQPSGTARTRPRSETTAGKDSSVRTERCTERCNRQAASKANSRRAQLESTRVLLRLNAPKDWRWPGMARSHSSRQVWWNGRPHCECRETGGFSCSQIRERHGDGHGEEANRAERRGRLRWRPFAPERSGKPRLESGRPLIPPPKHRVQGSTGGLQRGVLLRKHWAPHRT